MTSTIEVGNHLRLNVPRASCNVYLFDKTNYTFSESQIPYFAQITHGEFRFSDINQNHSYEPLDNCVFILDKGFSNILNNALEPYLFYKIFENDNYIITKSSNN